MKTKSLSAFLLAAACALCFTSCAKEPTVLSGIVTSLAGDVTVNGTQATLGIAVHADDVVVTGNKSFAVIQVAETAVITVKENSRFKLNSASRDGQGKDSIDCFASKGGIFNKIVKQGSDYRIATPTAVAAVRGTSFLVEVEPAGTNITVFNGVVSVTRNVAPAEQKEQAVEGQDPIRLKEGNSLFVGNNKNEPLPAQKSAEKKVIADLKYLDTIAIVPKADKNMPQDVFKGVVPNEAKDVLLRKDSGAAKEGKGKETSSERKTTKTSAGKKRAFNQPIKKISADKLAALKAKSEKKQLTKEEIKTTFERIDEIHLYSGRVVTGAVIERNDALETYSVLTANGVVTVKEEEIQTVNVIR